MSNFTTTPAKEPSAIAQAETEESRTQLKGLRYLLLKNRAKFSQSDQGRLEQLVQNHPKLYQLWLLRQGLHDWSEHIRSPSAVE